MSIELLTKVLGWCSLINIGLLLWWWCVLVFAHDWVYKIHTRWFKLSVEAFDTVHYSAIAFFKLVVFVFNIVPYIALQIVV